MEIENDNGEREEKGGEEEDVRNSIAGKARNKREATKEFIRTTQSITTSHDLTMPMKFRCSSHKTAK